MTGFINPECDGGHKKRDLTCPCNAPRTNSQMARGESEVMGLPDKKARPVSFIGDPLAGWYERFKEKGRPEGRPLPPDGARLKKGFER